MGLYDTIKVNDCTLEIEITGERCYYQTCDLGRNLYLYKFNSDNQLTYVDEVVPYEGDMEIIGCFLKENSKHVIITYQLTFKDSKVIKVTKMSEFEYAVNEGFVHLTGTGRTQSAFITTSVKQE